ncbi:MAG TPA: hypothetical protein VL221_04595 [Bacteroidota bacterium]|nr:hypothetical protein [Bacteroidota bacterium]
MRLVTILLILYALLIPDAGFAQEHAFTLSPFLSYDRYRISGFDAGFDYGAALGVRIADRLALRAEAAFGSRSIAFDAIGGTESLGAHLTELSIGAEYRLIGDARGASLSLSLGGGRLAATVDAATVSLGALGTLAVPSRASARNFLEGGLTACLPLAGGLGLFVRPALRAAVQAPAASDFSVEGGLRVALF